ncbi:MAG TPA: dihydroorotate dehydrogenase [Bdellovibrionota bacterium]|nr:dihydroorotate dehydrogenase [Bdellovibrionota bacterium]
MASRAERTGKKFTVDLSTQVGPLKLKNPVLAASGTFGYGLEFAHLVDLNRLGGFVTKGLSLQPRAGNPPPRIHETACGMLNSIGLHNIGVEAFLRDKLPALRKYDTAVIANIYGETPDDFVSVARELNNSEGLAALEINVSCPNVAKGGLDLGTDPEEVQKLVERIRKITKLPLWAKLTPNVTDIQAIARAAINGGANALSLINTIRGMSVDLDKRTPHLSSVTGGLSGPAIKPVALAHIYEVAKSFDIPIVGIGGIASGRDALEFMVVGASAVQIGTQNFVRSNACITILDEMEAFLREKQIPKVTNVNRTLSTYSQSTAVALDR